MMMELSIGRSVTPIEPWGDERGGELRSHGSGSHWTGEWRKNRSGHKDSPVPSHDAQSIRRGRKSELVGSWSRFRLPESMNRMLFLLG